MRRDLSALCLIAAGVGTFFVLRWLTSGVLFTGDLVSVFVPLESLYARVQAEGGSALWAPELQGGYPLLGSGHLHYFYPPHVLLRAFLPGVWVINVSLLAHALLSALGTFALLRRSGVGRAAAVVGAFLAPFGSAMVARYGAPNHVLPLSWLPLLLFLLLHFLQRRDHRALLLWVLAAAFFSLSGHPQMVLMGVVAQGVTVAFYAKALRWRVVLPLGGAVLLVGFLILPQYWPLLELIPHTARAERPPDEELVGFAFTPAVFRGLVVPHPFGQGASYRGPKNEAELAAFVGPVALALAVLGAVGRAPPPRRRLRWVAFALLALGVLLALDERMLVPWRPWVAPWRLLGAPARWFLLAQIGLALLSGMGADRLFRRFRTPVSRRVGVVVVTLLALSPVLRTAWTWNPGTPVAAARRPPLAESLLAQGEKVRLISRAGLTAAAPTDFGLKVGFPLRHPTVVRQSFQSPTEQIAGVRVRFSAAPKPTAAPLRLRVLAAGGSVLRDLVISTSAVRDSEWTAFTFPPLTGVRGRPFLLELSAPETKDRERAARVYVQTNPGDDQYDPTGELSLCGRGNCRTPTADGRALDLSFEVDAGATAFVAEHERLRPNVASGAGLGAVQKTGALGIQGVSDYIRSFGEDQPAEAAYIAGRLRAARALADRFPVTHFVGDYAPHRGLAGLAGVTEVARVDLGGTVIRAYRNEAAFPRIGFARRVRAVAGSEAQRVALEKLPADDRDTVVAELPADADFTNATHVRTLADTRTLLVLETDTVGAGYLVVRDIWYPGWRASVDDQPSRMVRTDSLFRGLVLPPGRHRVTFRYQPAWAAPAATVFAVGTLATALWAYRTFRRHRRTNTAIG